MNTYLKQWITGAFFCLCTVVSLQAQNYDPTEVTALKTFFNLPSATPGKTNAEVLGIDDVDNWDPATTPVNITWDNEPTKHVSELWWTGMNIGDHLDLTAMTKIAVVNVDKNGLKKLTFPETALLLRNILAGESMLDTINLPVSAPQLSVLQCFQSQLTYLDIPSDATSLADLRFHSSKIKRLSLPQAPMNELVYLWAQHNELTEIVLPPQMNKLRYLYLNHNKLTSITMPTQYLNALQYMYVENNALTYETVPAYPKTLATYGSTAGLYAATPQDTMREEDIDVSAEINLSSQYSTTINESTKTTEYDWYYLTENLVEKSVPSGSVMTSGDGRFTIASYMTGRSLRCYMKNANFPSFSDNHDGNTMKEFNTPLIYEVKIMGDTVAFPNATFHINASAGNGGTISPNGLVAVGEGANQLFTITPDEGYAISQVLVDGVNQPEAVLNGQYQFTDVIQNHSIVAEFTIVNDINEIESVSRIAYPNPTSGQLRITNHESEITNICVFDITGRLVKAIYNINNTEANIDLSDCTNGVYLLNVDGETMKIVKQ